MNKNAFLLAALALILASPCLAETEKTAATPEILIGTYQGRLTYMAVGGKALKEFDYSIEILKVDKQTGKVVMKATSDFYYSKDIKRNNCELVEGKSFPSFTCKGDGWHEDFEIKEDSLKANCISKQNLPYYISATRAKK